MTEIMVQNYPLVSIKEIFHPPQIIQMTETKIQNDDSSLTDKILIVIKLLDNLNQVNTNTIISSCLHFKLVGFMFYIIDYFHSI